MAYAGVIKGWARAWSTGFRYKPKYMISAAQCVTYILIALLGYTVFQQGNAKRAYERRKIGSCGLNNRNIQYNMFFFPTWMRGIRSCAMEAPMEGSTLCSALHFADSSRGAFNVGPQTVRCSWCTLEHWQRPTSYGPMGTKPSGTTSLSSSRKPLATFCFAQHFSSAVAAPPKYYAWFPSWELRHWRRCSILDTRGATCYQRWRR